MKKATSKPKASRDEVTPSHSVAPNYEVHLNYIAGGNPDVIKVYKRVTADLSWLYKKAMAKDASACTALVSAATHGAELIHDITSTDLPFAQRISQKTTVWPVLISRSTAYPIDIDAQRKLLNIGIFDSIPFDLYKRYASKRNSPSRVIIESASLFIDWVRRILYCNYAIVEMLYSLTYMKWQLQSLPLPASKKAKFKHTLKELKSSISYCVTANDKCKPYLTTHLQRLTSLLRLNISNPQSYHCPLTYIALTPVNFSFQTDPTTFNSDYFDKDFNKFIEYVAGLGPLTPEVKDNWWGAIEWCLLLICGHNLLKSDTLLQVGKSATLKPYLEKAAGDVRACLQISSTNQEQRLGRRRRRSQ